MEAVAPTTPSTPDPQKPFHPAELAAYLVPALVFLLFKAYAMPTPSGDENIYFYAGRRVAQGLWPYREVFFAHPPAHLFLSALWMLPGLVAPFWLKLASVLPALLMILVIVRLSLRSGLGWMAALISGLLLAISENSLSVSSHFTGANWGNLWLVLGLWAFVEERPRLGGIFLVLGGLTVVHVLPAAFFMLLGILALRPRQGWRGGLVFLGFFGTVQLACLLLFGDAYYRQAILYHLSKTPMSGGGDASVYRFFHGEYVPAGLALLGLILLAARLGRTWPWRIPAESAPRSKKKKAKNPEAPPRRAWEKDERLALLALAAALGQIAAVLWVERVFTYYLAPLLPFFALLSGYFVAELVGLARQGRARLKPKKLLMAGALGLIFVVTCVAGEKMEAGIGYYKREYGQISSYVWKDSPLLPDSVNAAVHALFWRDERRVGDVYSGLTKYLWHESATEDAAVLLSELQKLDAVPGTLFGDASTAPFYALRTGRRIALEQADTNAQLFKSGLLSMPSLLADLEKAPPAFLILGERRGISTHPDFLGWVKAHYGQLARLRSDKEDWLSLYRRREGPP